MILEKYFPAFDKMSSVDMASILDVFASKDFGTFCSILNRFNLGHCQYSNERRINLRCIIHHHCFVLFYNGKQVLSYHVCSDFEISWLLPWAT